MRLAFYSLGCKVNQAEIENWQNYLGQNFKIVNFNSRADIYIINSCSVTQKAERESRQKISQARQQNSRALIVASGCLLDHKLPQIDLWIDNFKKDNLPLILKDHLKIKKLLSVKNKAQNLTRALVKIQSGCDNFCAYCIVPFLRGRPQSFSNRDIIQQIKNLIKAGHQEAVLVGTNIAKYDYQGFNLADLIQQILEETSLPRLHLSSLWPSHLNSALIKLFQHPRLCPHIHLSLQSASNQILKKMGRNYTRRQVLKIIQQLRQIQPRINFTVDIIVGFPGETEKDFQQTYDFCQQVGFYKIHVFRYSVRQGTRSADFKNQISLETKKARSLELRQLDLILRQRVVNNFLNTNSEVLFENKIGDTWQGWTDNYIKAYFKTDKDLHNQTIKVKLIKNFKNGVLVEENGLT